MKKLLVSVLIISLMLTACGNTKGSQESNSTVDKEDSQKSDSTVDIDASEETIETMEAKPVPAPVEETVEPEESVTEPVEEVAESEEAEIPESDRGTNTYSTFVPKVVTFEISDNILTVATDDGSRFGWSDGKGGFTISYPVAEDCIWETGYFATDFVAEDTTDYESVKSYIENEQAGYVEGLAMGDFEVSSPMGIYIEVTDGVIVRVYTVFS